MFRRTFGILTFFAVIASFPVGAAQAQPTTTLQDHLTCYRTRDPAKVAYALDLLAIKQPEFSAKGCKVSPKSLAFCVPSTKILRNPNVPKVNLPGVPLDFDYVMYKIRCPDQAPPPRKLVTDQLAGPRILRFAAPIALLVPATKQNPPCAPVGARKCGGECPNGEACVPDTADKGCICQPPPRPCGIDAAGTCGGDCPAGTTDICQIRIDPTGQTKCECGPPPSSGCGLHPGANQCSGSCLNPGDVCRTYVTAAGGITCDCSR